MVKFRKIQYSNSEKNAKHFAEHFNNLSFILSDGQQFFCEAGFGLDEGGVKGKNYWCVVSSIKANKKDINVFEDWQKMNEIAFRLYERLKLAPTFRYALIGVEVDQFLSYEELISDKVAEEKTNINGLVISENIWKKLNSPRSFVNFQSGYLWIPFCPLGDYIQGTKLKEN